MAYLNQCSFIGNLTADPTPRETVNGAKYTTFTLAVSRPFRQENGEWAEETSFVDFVAWNARAEFAAKNLAKGLTTFVSGSIKQDTWEDKETGKKRSRYTIIVENIQLISRRKDGTQAPPQQPQQNNGYRREQPQPQQSWNQQPRQPQQQSWNQQPQATQQPQAEQGDIPF